MRGSLNITFSTDNLSAVSDLKAAILAIAPHMLDNISVTESYHGYDAPVQFVLDNFEDLRVKHSRTNLRPTPSRVSIARLLADEFDYINLSKAVELIKADGRF